MLKNCNGFSLIEVFIAFNLFLWLLLFIVPQVVIVKRERNELEKERMAYNILHDQIQRYIYDRTQEEEIIRQGTSYKIFWETNRNHLAKGCIEWQEKNDHFKKRCLYAKR